MIDCDFSLLPDTVLHLPVHVIIPPHLNETLEHYLGS